MERQKTTPFTIDFLLKHPPFFVNGIIRRSREIGMSQAGFELCQNANIRVVIEGNSEALRTSRCPALLVADHMSGIDNALLFATLPLLGREDVKLTAKPYTLDSHFVELIRRPGEECIIPLVPSYMARDRKSAMPFEDRVMRYCLRKKLLTAREIQYLNDTSFKRAAILVTEGNAVNILPEGYPTKGTQAWRKGVGEIIKLIPDDIYDQTTVVPYRFQEINQKRVLLALLFASLARFLPEQVITLRLGQEETLEQLFPGNDIQSLSAFEIAPKLQAWYRKQFT